MEEWIGLESYKCVVFGGPPFKAPLAGIVRLVENFYGKQ